MAPIQHATKLEDVKVLKGYEWFPKSPSAWNLESRKGQILELRTIAPLQSYVPTCCRVRVALEVMSPAREWMWHALPLMFLVWHENYWMVVPYEDEVPAAYAQCRAAASGETHRATALDWAEEIGRKIDLQTRLVKAYEAELEGALRDLAKHTLSGDSTEDPRRAAVALHNKYREALRYLEGLERELKEAERP